MVARTISMIIYDFRLRLYVYMGKSAHHKSQITNFDEFIFSTYFENERQQI